MKVTIERSILAKALGHVQSVVERRTTIPILSNVLLQADKTGLTLTATDLDIEVLETTQADVDAPGATTVSAVTLFEIVKRLPDGTQVLLELLASEGRLQVVAGRSRFALAVLPDADFPSLSSDDYDVEFSMQTSELRRLLEKSRFAMSQEETRYYLNGVYMHVRESGDDNPEPSLRVAATDGHRLARLETTLPDEAAGMPGVIIPRKAVAELGRLLDDADEAVRIAVSPSKIRFGLGSGRLTSKLIDGTFPDYERVIPSNNPHTLKLDNSDFAKAVDRVSTVSADRTKSVKLALDKDRLRLTVNNPDAGSALEELSVDFTGEPTEIGFNAKYLLDISNQIESEQAVFKLDDPSSPTVILDEADEHALYVLMPLRV